MSKDWFRSGFFDDAMGEILFDAASVKAAKEEVQGLLRLAHPQAGATVLDLACGVGRHSLEFARRGYAVTGLDLSEAYIREGIARSRRARLKGLRFEKGELLDLYRFQGEFDLVVNLFTSFGYYASAKDNFESLKQMALALKPGGQLLMELMPRESLELHFVDRHWERSGSAYLLSERRWIQGGRKLRADSLWLGKAARRELASEIFVYGVDELSALFRRAGLKKVRAFGGFKGEVWQPGLRLLLQGVR